MVKRGPHERPQASEERSHETLCRLGCVDKRDQCVRQARCETILLGAIVASCYDRRARSEPVSDCRKVRASMGAALRQSDKIVVLKRELANGV
jgi:hypothetical protein